MFNPARLVVARKRRGLSSKQLASKVGLSPITITRLEKEGNPEQTTLESLSAALNFPIDFFFGNDIDVPTKDSASFRSLSKMKASERDAALTAGSLAFLFDDWIDERFRRPELNLISMPNSIEPEAAALTLRNHWGIGQKPIGDTIKLLEAQGIRVFSLAESTKNVDAFSTWRDDKPYIFLNTFKTAEHSRFDAMHELGHLVLHKHGASKGREAETEANKFASNFLMPREDLIGSVPRPKNLDAIVRAKKRWGVSASALNYRLHKEGLISEWEYRSYCIQINKQYGITEPNGQAREKSTLWEKVFRELWKDGVSRKNIAADLAIDESEIDNLVFGLLTPIEREGAKLDEEFQAGLRLVK